MANIRTPHYRVSPFAFTDASQRNDAAALPSIRRSIGFAGVVADEVAVADRRRPGTCVAAMTGLELEF
jgi:hypothetical protein